MRKRKCFLKTPKKSNMFPYINRLHDILTDRIPFRSSACYRSHRGRDLPTVRERSGLVKTRTQGRAIWASAACSPAWLIIQSKTASFTGCAALHADRGGPQNGPRRMLHVRTASASIAPSTERVPLPSDPNAPRYHPLPPAKPNQLRCINNLHAHKSHPSHPL